MEWHGEWCSRRLEFVDVDRQSDTATFAMVRPITTAERNSRAQLQPKGGHNRKIGKGGASAMKGKTSQAKRSNSSELLAGEWRAEEEEEEEEGGS